MSRFCFVRFLVRGSLLAAMLMPPWVFSEEPHEMVLNRHDLAVMDSRIHDSFDAMGILLENPALSSYLNNIVASLQSPECSGADCRYTVKVIRSSDVNAFSLSDGTIYISLTMFGLIANTSQLAFLLAHEMEHIRLNHHIESKYELHAQALKAAQGQIVGSIFGVSVSPSHRTRAALSGFSKNNETEADSSALQLLATQGFATASAIELFRVMSTWLEYKERKIQPEYATHPKLMVRYNACKKLLGQSGSAPVITTTGNTYNAMVARLLPSIAQLFLMSNSVHELHTMALEKIRVPGSGLIWDYIRGKLLELYWPTDSFSTAIESFRIAAEQSSTEGARALRDAGWLFIKNKQPDSARVYLQEYLRRGAPDGDSALVCYYLGLNR